MQNFSKEQVEGDRPDGFWLEAFPYRADAASLPDLVGYGLGTPQEDSKIHVYTNPHNAHSGMSSGHVWTKTQIAELKFPVAFAFADITGNGYNDIILSDKYGSSITDIRPDGGRVSWFENPGDAGEPHWKQRYIGESPGMHRLRTGHFTTKDVPQIIAVPVVIKSSDYTSPVPVIIYTAPKNLHEDNDAGWPHEVAFADKFRIVHEVIVVPSPDGGLDKVLLAGREGVSLIWYDTKVKPEQWKSETIGTGLPEAAGNPFWGAGSVAIAKVHGDRVGYIAACEAFHGNGVSVFVKDKGSPANELIGQRWKRIVLEDFGPLNKEHTGSIHYVTCVDVDGDGVDEILVALIGSTPASWKKTGVWCYKPVNLETGTFTKFKLSDDSAGSIAVADFKGRGTVDFATISYSIPGYFESPNPSINVYFNSSITAEKLGDEVLFRVPRLTTSYFIDEVEFLDVAGRRLSLVVVPPNRKYSIDRGDGLKIIAGTVHWIDDAGAVHTRALATKRQEVVSIVVESKDEQIQAGGDGALFMLLKKSADSGTPLYSDMKALVANNIFPERIGDDVRAMMFPWVKVEDRPWAHGDFKGLEFYNLIGFHVFYADDAVEKVCHIQLWTAGIGVSTGFHNHLDASFCEIHACIVNGTGMGGMYWATGSDDELDPEKPDKKKYMGIVVPSMAEHGPLWRTGPDGMPLLRSNDTIDYPWHAWIAGDGPKKQAFDVWLAFEFPPFVAPIRSDGILPLGRPQPEKMYKIHNPATNLVLAIKDGDFANGTPLIAQVYDSDNSSDKWTFSTVPGTDLYILNNVKAGSAATVKWPVIDKQSLVGNHSPARLNVTSAWSLQNDHSNFELKLIGTSFVLTVCEEQQGHRKVSITVSCGNDSQKWCFTEVDV